MLNFPGWKVALISFVLLFGALFALPNVLSDGFMGVQPVDTGSEDPVAVAALETQRAEAEASWWPGFLPTNKMNLGLDLQGGVYLLIELDTAEVAANRLEAVQRDITAELNKRTDNNMVERNLERNGDRMTIELLKPEEGDMAEAMRRLRRINPPIGSTTTELMTFNQVDADTIQITVGEAARAALGKEAQSKTMTIIRRRIDPDGVSEISITPQGNNRVILEAPGEANPQRIKRNLERAGRLTFNKADLSQSAVAAAQNARRQSGRWRLVQSIDQGPMLIQSPPIMEGDAIVSANRGYDENNRAAVNFTLSGKAKKDFYDLTRRSRGEFFAIVLDDVVMSAPRINDPIPGGNVQITGSFSLDEADELAAIISAGALPAKLTFLEERTIGPQLGAESIESGARASILGIILVGIFMMLAYGLIGGFAVGSLAANIVLIVGALSGLGATLTLPGIAGIILTIGMAVDANVIVFERVREEQAAGRSPATALQAGYERAFSAILDANVTTFIAATILFLVGAGPVKGFAVTLAIGIITSVFTAFVVTRWFTVIYLRTARPKRLAM